MEIATSQDVLSMSIYAIGLLFLVKGLHKNRVPLAFKDI